MEQRYRAVLQVQAGVPVTEVADAFGASRQAVHRWLRWYREAGLSGWATGRTAHMSIRGRSTGGGGGDLRDAPQPSAPG
jgi:transposase-like protein